MNTKYFALFVLLAACAGDPPLSSPSPDLGAAPDLAAPPDLASPDLAPAAPHCTSEFLYTHDRQLFLGDAPFFAKSVNYSFDVRYDPATGKHYIGPHAKFCDDGCCIDEASCKVAAQQQLAQIKAMGMNSLRVVGLGITPRPEGLRIECLQQTTPTQLDFCPVDKNLVMEAPYEPALTLIEDAMKLVHDAGLRVVLLAGHAKLDAPEHRDAYAAYLTALASRFKNDPTIFAYDLANEPFYEFVNKSPTKQEANNLVTQWYSAVKTGSPRHMVTMGIGGFDGAMNWDPGILPLDFISHHVYVNGLFNTTNQDYLATYYNWISHQPFTSLIGETGMCVEGMVTDDMQRDYAQFSLAEAWASGTVGVQWWFYRDVHWGPPGEKFGLVRWDGSQRPAAAAFTAFQPTMPRPALAVPAYEGSTPEGQTHTTGRVLDANGAPIWGAYVRAHNCTLGGYVWTLSKQDGTFDLRSIVPVESVKVSAPGLSIEERLSYCGIVANVGDIALTLEPATRIIPGPSSCPM